MLTIFGFAARYLNRRSTVFGYLSPAVYPVYIVHMPIQFVASAVVFNLGLPGVVELVVLIAVTIGFGLLLYEGLSRVPFVRVLFGISKPRRSAPSPVTIQS
jgi:surface polysaccharide O-acyltransferase-like enzyme